MGFDAVRRMVDPDGSLRFGAYPADPAHDLRVRERINARLAPVRQP